MLFSEKIKVHNLFMKMKFTPYIGNIYGWICSKFFLVIYSDIINKHMCRNVRVKISILLKTGFYTTFKVVHVL